MIARSSVYFTPIKKKEDKLVAKKIKKIFKDSRNNYGARKIKKELVKINLIVSRRRIRRLLNELGMVSTYTVKQYKTTKTACNNDEIDNIVNR